MNTDVKWGLIFFGTSEFAIPGLQALLRDARFDIFAIVTQPDRPVGRHAILTPPPVKKELTVSHPTIPFFQPQTLKSLREDKNFQKILRHAPDAFVVISYGKILPTWLLDIPKQGAVNVHGSLLPRWRGASPIQATIAAGDNLTGITVMKMDADLDHGPIIGIDEEPVLETDTAQTLHDRLADRAAQLLPDVLAQYLSGTIEPQEQDHDRATFCRVLTREDGKIDWDKTSEEIERLVRAYNPWPSTWTDIQGKRLKVLSARVAPVDMKKTAGQFFKTDKRFFVGCAQGTILELLRVQPEGGKIMSAEEYLRGNTLG